MIGIMLFTPKARPTPAPARILAAAALLVFGGALASFSAACVTDNPPGGDCLKDDDCESRHCVQLTCIAAGTGQQPQPDTGTTGGGADTGSAVADAPVDSGVTADTGATGG